MEKHTLIVAATAAEINPLLKYFKVGKLNANGIASFQFKKKPLKVLIAGVGTPQFIYNLLTEITLNRPAFVINAGIAGCYHNSIKIGSTVFVKQDCFADIGAENDRDFISAFDLNLDSPLKFPYNKGKLKVTRHPSINALEKLMKVNAITANTSHGNEQSIEMYRKFYKPDIETMEGAAAIYVCKRQGIPVVQLRSISNLVEKRNRDAWNIPLAIESLNKTLIKVIKELHEIQ